MRSMSRRPQKRSKQALKERKSILTVRMYLRKAVFYSLRYRGLKLCLNNNDDDDKIGRQRRSRKEKIQRKVRVREAI